MNFRVRDSAASACRFRNCFACSGWVRGLRVLLDFACNFRAQDYRILSEGAEAEEQEEEGKTQPVQVKGIWFGGGLHRFL